MAGMELRVFTEPQQGASYDDLLRVAQTTEELGFGAGPPTLEDLLTERGTRELDAEHRGHVAVVENRIHFDDLEGPREL